MIEYLGKVYNFTFLKGIVQEKYSKNNNSNRWIWMDSTKDGPIVPIV